jgi:hypothetical protein
MRLLRLLLVRDSRRNRRGNGRRRAAPRLRIEVLEGRALPSTVTWINPGGGDWDTAANWLDGTTGTNHVPGPAEDAVIDTPGITVTHSSFFSSDSVHSLTSAATLAVSNGTLSIAADSEVDSLNLSGGTLTGAGTLTIDNAFTWAGGTMSGTGHTVLNGSATVGGIFSGPLLDTRTLDNAGSATVPDGQTLSFAHDAVWNNEAGATLTLRGNSSLNPFFGQSGRLSNDGLLLHSGADNSTSNINLPFDNTGTVSVRTGALNLASLTNEGELDLGAGALATLSGGSSSGALVLAADSALSISGAFTQQAGGTVDLAAGSSLTTGTAYTMQDDTAISGPGTVVLSGGFFGGTLNVAGGARIDNLASTGTVLVPAGGSLDVGTLALAAGTVNVAAGGSLDSQTLNQIGGTLTGPGTATIDGTLTWVGGTMSGTGHTVVNGTATVGGIFSGPLLDTRTLDNAGSATVPDGQVLRFDHNALWNNEAGATLTLRGNSSLGNFLGQSGRLNNDGLLVHSGADNSFSGVNFPLDNTATVSVLTGTLNLTSSLTNEGQFDLAAGALASLSGGSSSGALVLAADSALNLTPSALNPTATFTQQAGGTVDLAAGSALNIVGFGGATYTMQDGTAVSGPGTVVLTGGGTLNVAGGARIDNLTTTGTVSVPDVGSLTVQNLALGSGTVTIAAKGIVDAQNLTQTAGTLTGAGTAVIDGTLTWAAGTMSGTGHTVLNGTATVGFRFGPTLDTRTLDNAGSITVPDGHGLLLANNALLNNEAGATLTLQGSGALDHFFGPPGRLSNAGLLVTTGHGQATINLAVTNSGTVDLQGVLSIGGNYTQSADGTLNLHLAGTAVGSQYDQLQVHGAAVLDGTLNVTLVNGFTPANGNTFRILTFNSRSGDFAAMNLPDPGNGLVLNPMYDGSGLTLLTEPAGP